MRKWMWTALVVIPLAVAGGLVYARSQPSSAGGFICPVTGEELPCPLCCPLNESQ